MEMIKIHRTDLTVSRFGYGCMRITGDGSTEALKKGKQAVLAAVSAGYNQFDHADIYGRGECEVLFGEILKENAGLRESIILTSKCGIRIENKPNLGDPQRYDFSKKHIIHSIEGSLQRLGSDRLDLLLLHRPDYLFDPEEVVAAFIELHKSGKVLNFGVSNFYPSQVRMLQQHCPFPLAVNQIEINIHNIKAFTDGTLDQCLEQGIAPQAWCPVGGVAYPAWGNTFSAEDEQRIFSEISRQAEKYETADWILILAWILKHPAQIQPLIGSTQPQRIQDALTALDIEYSRADWYRLWEARAGHPVA